MAEPANDDVPASPPLDASPGAARRSRRRWLVGLGGVTLVALLALVYWLYARQFETTDDAQIDGDITNLSPRVAGTVKAVYVVEDQRVEAGQPLLELDPADLEVATAQAEASLARARAELAQQDPSVSITVASNRAALASGASDLASAQASVAEARRSFDQEQAQLAQARASNDTAQLDRARAEKLVAEGAIAQAEADQRINAARASAANVDALAQSVAAARERIREQEAKLAVARSRLREVQANAPRQEETQRAAVLARAATRDLAQAELDQAQLNLGYAQIASPISGVVGKKSVEVGDRVAPGQQLMAIAQVDAPWVTANFRETQIELMHVGLAAEVHVDAIDRTLRGSIEAFGGATGSRLSVLPPENATGNYVKVVQRVPVRIALEPDQPGMERLRPGMSVEVRVRVR